MADSLVAIVEARASLLRLCNLRPGGASRATGARMHSAARGFRATLGEKSYFAGTFFSSAAIAEWPAAQPMASRPV